MFPSTAKLGFWAATLAAFVNLVFVACFIGNALVNPLFTWTALDSYVAYMRAHDRTLVTVAQACMLLMGPLFVVLVSCLHEVAPPERKTAVRAALALSVGFAVLTGINYWTQITAVRFNLARGTTAGLEQFLQSKPDSAMASINMLGWTMYFGLSSLLASMAFAPNAPKLERAIRVALVANGVCCLLAGGGFFIDNILLIFVTINLGMGAAITTATILLAVFFGRVGELPANSLTQAAR